MSSTVPHARKTPLPVKIAFTAFMAVLIPVYWTHYGPSNFLYFCDLALLFTLAGIWTDSALLVSIPAVGILAPQILWVVDFALNLIGIRLTGMTDYMFDASSPLFLRALSFFHGWLPFLLFYLVSRLGYDRRALFAWSGVAWAAMLIAFFFLPPSGPHVGLTPVNVDYVFGPSDSAPQHWMPAWAWLALLMAAMPTLLCAPVHLVLLRLQAARRNGD